MVKNPVARAGAPMSRKQWVLSIALVAGVSVVLGPAVVDQFFQLRTSVTARGAYAPLSGQAGRDQLVERAIQDRILLLTRPRDTTGSIGGDPSARLIEAGLLYGRLAVLQESQGRARESIASMQRAVGLLKEAGHPDPTEAHIRRMVAKAEAARVRAK